VGIGDTFWADRVLSY